MKPRIQTVSSKFSVAWPFVLLVPWVALPVRLEVSCAGYWSEPGLAICSAVTDADRVMNVIHRYTAAARYLNFM